MSFNSAKNVLFILMMLINLLEISSPVKIIFLYATCDDQLAYVLHLMHKSLRSYVNSSEEYPSNFFAVHQEAHKRHDLSHPCLWVQQETIAVVAISSETEKWESIYSSAANLSIPLYQSPNRCRCRPLSVNNGQQNLETAVFEYLKGDFLHHVIILNEADKTGGEILSKNLNEHGVRVSHLRLADQHRCGIMGIVEKYFDAWNMVDLSHEGKMLISLGGGSLADKVIKNMVESNMRNKRMQLLIMDDPKKWQARIGKVLSYEVDLVVVSSEPLRIEDCPIAMELLPEGSHSHDIEGACANLSSNLQKLGEIVLQDFQRNFKRGCCLRPDTVFYTFWTSWPSENATQSLRPEAIWSRDLGLLRMTPIDLKSLTIRIVAMQYSPYVDTTRKGKEIKLEDCVFKNVIDFLSERLNIKYRIVFPLDGLWGNRINSTEWNGAIGMLFKGEADMIPYLMSTPLRREAVDFSKPLAYVKYGLLVAFPSEPPRAFIFLRPYRKEVWFLLVVAAIAVSFVLYKVHHYSVRICNVDRKSTKGLSSFFRCLWVTFGAMLNQGSVHLPTTNSARLVLASWWIAVLVVLATYSANLIAFLAFPQERWVVKSLEDVINHKSIHLAIKQDSAILEDFKESRIDVHRRIREIFLDVPGRGHIIQRNDTTFIEGVASGETVFIDDINSLHLLLDEDYKSKGHCRLTIAPNTFSRVELALAFRRGSSLLKVVNDEIQKMLESGILSHWKRRSSPDREECFTYQNNYGQSSIALDDLQGPFYLIAIGLVFGIAFLTSECIWNWTRDAYRRFLSRKLLQRHCSVIYW